MTAVPMLIAPSLRSAMIAEKHEPRMVGLGRAPQKIKKRIVVNKEVCRVSMLRTNDIRALDWITSKKDWPIEANNVIITLTCVQLDREASRVAGEIGKLAAKGDGAEAKKQGCLLPNLA